LEGTKMTIYKIKDKQGISFGYFKEKSDRDFALRHFVTDYGIPCEEE